MDKHLGSIMSKETRKEHNSSVLDRFFNGESLSSFRAMDSWFPPRPVIKKNKKTLKFIFKGVEDGGRAKNKSTGRLRVVPDCN